VWCGGEGREGCEGLFVLQAMQGKTHVAKPDL
jgi:hypothetical protein